MMHQLNTQRLHLNAQCVEPNRRVDQGMPVPLRRPQAMLKELCDHFVPFPPVRAFSFRTRSYKASLFPQQPNQMPHAPVRRAPAAVVVCRHTLFDDIRHRASIGARVPSRAPLQHTDQRVQALQTLVSNPIRHVLAPKRQRVEKHHERSLLPERVRVHMLHQPRELHAPHASLPRIWSVIRLQRHAAHLRLVKLNMGHDDIVKPGQGRMKHRPRELLHRLARRSTNCVEEGHGCI
mmetsp:Transcript_2052/g.6641  ORF Transcript_2052/g.6641 Transcript_2052/m.6641 type:complete len:235 (-) Transcript_2052:561-1265(-)